MRIPVACVIALTMLLAQSIVLNGQATLSVPLINKQVDVLRLAPDQTTNQSSFDVDDAQNVRIVVTSTNAGVVVTVQGPGSQTVTIQNVGSFGGSGSEIDLTGVEGLMPFLSGHRTQFDFPSFGAGQYTVLLDGTALSEETGAVVEVDTDSTLGFSFFTLSPRSPAGVPVALSLALFDGSTPVLGATVTVDVVDAASGTTPVSLLDDGTGPDSASDDGMYIGVFTPTGSGAHVASATISGTRPTNSESFTRTAATSFEVLPLSGRLTGTYVDSGVDSDSDQLFDSIALDVDVDASVAGNYRVYVDLEAPNDNRLTAMGTREGMQVGQQAVTVTIPMQKLRTLADPGPYTIASARLEYESPTDGWQNAHLLMDLGETSAYPFNSLKPLPVAFDSFADAGVDDDEDETYDRLSVALDIDVATAGIYSRTLTLQTGAGATISTVRDSGYLEAGPQEITVDFFGPDIRATGVDGPYLLKALRLQGKGDVLAIADVGTTQTYLATDFDTLSPHIVRISPEFAAAGGSASVVIDVAEVDLPIDGAGVSLDFGADITVSNLNVIPPDRVAADLTIDAGADTGPRSVTVLSSAGNATREEGFWVDPPQDEETLLSVSPSVGGQGEALEVTIEGQGTTFSDPMYVWIGNGEPVQATVVDADTAIATVEIHNATDPGVYAVSAEYGETSSRLDDAFEVQLTPQLWSVYPPATSPPQTLQVELHGHGSSFSQTASTVDFGSGVTVTSMTVVSEEIIEVTIEVDEQATLGPRTVTVTTGAQVLSRDDSFTLNAP